MNAKGVAIAGIERLLHDDEAASECENAVKQHMSVETFRVFDVVALGMKSDRIFFP